MTNSALEAGEVRVLCVLEYDRFSAQALSDEAVPLLYFAHHDFVFSIAPGFFGLLSGFLRLLDRLLFVFRIWTEECVDWW